MKVVIYTLFIHNRYDFLTFYDVNYSYVMYADTKSQHVLHFLHRNSIEIQDTYNVIDFLKDAQLIWVLI